MNSPLDIIMHRIWERKVAFFTVFFFVILITYAILFFVDFIPEPIDTIDEQESEEVAGNLDTDRPETISVTQEAILPVGASSLPIKIIFDDLNNKEVTVLNPSSNDIAALDNALLRGVVRHPDSADFSEVGNIFILGHSSYLPNVLNKNYQAFNGIQRLSWGDTIRVQSDDTEYTYRVEEVFEAPASEIFVPETPGEAKLTLATCNVLGAKEDRFIVEAMLIDTKPL